MSEHDVKTVKKTALLLTGGGARAAYQVGVLKAIAQQFPRSSKLPFQIISGTSAGAMNGIAMACYASCFHLGVKKLEWIWRNFHTSQVYYADYPRVFRQLLRGAFSAFQADYANKQPVSLFDNKPLRQMLTKVLDLKRIDRNIMGGYLSSFSVTASCYNNGDSITFFQSDKAQEWRRAKRCGQRTLLGVQHLMASAAIPLVFPTVRIHQQYFGDGSRFGVNISYLYEKTRMGTAGALSLLPEVPQGSLIIMNGDILTNSNFCHLVNFHRQNKALATMCVREYEQQIPYGIVTANGMTLQSITEKPSHSYFVNAGIYVVDPDVLGFVPKDQYFDMPQLFDELQKAGKESSVFPIREYWLDIGRHEDLEQARTDYRKIFG